MKHVSCIIKNYFSTSCSPLSQIIFLLQVANPHAFTIKQIEMKNNVALGHHNHAGRSCSKFGLIPLRCSGGDSMMDRWTDKKIILLSHALTIWRSHVASLVIHPVVKKEIE